MPRYQGQLDLPRASNAWARADRRAVFGPNVEAITKAYADAGRAMPPEVLARTAGARDRQPE